MGTDLPVASQRLVGVDAVVTSITSSSDSFPLMHQQFPSHTMAFRREVRTAATRLTRSQKSLANVQQWARECKVPEGTQAHLVHEQRPGGLLHYRSVPQRGHRLRQPAVAHGRYEERGPVRAGKRLSLKRVMAAFLPSSGDQGSSKRCVPICSITASPPADSWTSCSSGTGGKTIAPPPLPLAPARVRPSMGRLCGCLAQFGIGAPLEHPAGAHLIPNYAPEAAADFVEAKLKCVMQQMCPPGLMERVVVAVFQELDVQRMCPPRWRNGFQLTLGGAGELRVELHSEDGDDQQLVVRARPAAAAVDPADRVRKLAVCWRMVKWMQPVLRGVFAGWDGLAVTEVASTNFCRSVHDPGRLGERVGRDGSEVPTVQLRCTNVMRYDERYHADVSRYIWSSFVTSDGKPYYVHASRDADPASVGEQHSLRGYGTAFVCWGDLGLANNRPELRRHISQSELNAAFRHFASWSKYNEATVATARHAGSGGSGGESRVWPLNQPSSSGKRTTNQIQMTETYQKGKWRRPQRPRANSHISLLRATWQRQDHQRPDGL